jgi:hypothetical protein
LGGGGFGTTRRQFLVARIIRWAGCDLDDPYLASHGNADNIGSAAIDDERELGHRSLPVRVEETLRTAADLSRALARGR